MCLGGQGHNPGDWEAFRRKIGPPNCSAELLGFLRRIGGVVAVVAEEVQGVGWGGSWGGVTTLRPWSNCPIAGCCRGVPGRMTPVCRNRPQPVGEGHLLERPADALSGSGLVYYWRSCLTCLALLLGLLAGFLACCRTWLVLASLLAHPAAHLPARPPACLAGGPV